MNSDYLYHSAAYIRLSREDGDKAESDSIANQKKLIADYLKDQSDCILYDTYVDDGFSGTTFSRPGFQKMISDIESGAVNCVIVKDLSRFGRDYIETGKYLERYFPDHAVRFIAITDHIDSAKRAYDMLLPIKNIFNEQYARDISGKIHASLSAKQKSGEFIGAFASYGYQKSPADKNKLVIDTYAAAIVKKIFNLYTEGCGKLRIASILNREGIPCPSEYKKLSGQNYRNSNRLESTSYWTYSTINRILHNEMYLGNMVQGKTCQQMRNKSREKNPSEWVIVPGTHEPIIDIFTWQKAQDLLCRRTRNLDLDSSRNIFAGFLKCGDCGRSLVKKRDCFYCGTYVRSGRQYCTPHLIARKTLENILSEDLHTVIRNTDNLEKIIALQDCGKVSGNQTNKSEKTRIQSELNKTRRMKKAVYEDYREELISREEFISYRKDYTQREELLINQLSCLEGNATAQTTETIFETPWIQHLLEYGNIQNLDREVIIAMLHEIRVYENHHIKIIYNFSDK